MANTRTALWVIVVAQFFGTSLWFTPNAVMPGLAQSWGVTAEDLGRLTGSVQLGFIIGTLAFALSGLADRWRASRIFLVSAVTGAVANGLFALSPSLKPVWRCGLPPGFALPVSTLWA